MGIKCNRDPLYKSCSPQNRNQYLRRKKPAFHKKFTILIGIGFAAGWTPCTGPILVSVIALAATKPSAAMLYMFAYVLGFAAPFFIMSFFIGKLNWIKKYNTVIVRVGEILMVIMGIMLFLDWMTKIIISFYRFVWRIHRFLISKISY
ncbi:MULTISPECIES: urease accessory protein UreH domain-containing protein [Geobacillus]|uniref:urease accessory protein UreH domain-containing protein n=1 Tax=Geobacillus TaxID=129337 RepID=UPI0035225DBE